MVGRLEKKRDTTNVRGAVEGLRSEYIGGDADMSAKLPFDDELEEALETHPVAADGEADTGSRWLLFNKSTSMRDKLLPTGTLSPRHTLSSSNLISTGQHLWERFSEIRRIISNEVLGVYE
jgi:hypothetical protein